MLPMQSSMLQAVLSTATPELILLQGKRFDEVPYYFPDGSVFGLVNIAAQRCLLNPPGDTRVQKGDALIMMRPTSIASDAYRPLPRPIAVSPGEVVPASCLAPALSPIVVSSDAAASRICLPWGSPGTAEPRLVRPGCIPASWAVLPQGQSCVAVHWAVPCSRPVLLEPSAPFCHSLR